MSVVKRAAIIVAGAVAAGVCLAAPAGADPGFDPCHAGVPLLCGMFPVMPDLDHDIDLSQDPDAANPPVPGHPGTGQPGTTQPGTTQPGAKQPGAELNGG